MRAHISPACRFRAEQTRRCIIKVEDATSAIEEDEMSQNISAPISVRDVKPNSISRQREQREDGAELRINFKIDNRVDAPSD